MADVGEQEPSIGDSVRVRASAETERSGHAGRTGTFYGCSTPSVTGVRFVGTTSIDLAYNVGFDGDQDEWFAPELVKLVDHAPGDDHR